MHTKCLLRYCTDLNVKILDVQYIITMGTAIYYYLSGYNMCFESYTLKIDNHKRIRIIMYIQNVYSCYDY